MPAFDSERPEQAGQLRGQQAGHPRRPEAHDRGAGAPRRSPAAARPRSAVPRAAERIRALQRTAGNAAVGDMIRHRSGPAPVVQRFREFDKVAGSKVYANGGKGIDGEDASHHFSMNPRGPASPVADHFNEVHVTFDEDAEGIPLPWDSRPHFYYSDAPNPTYIDKSGTGANQRFREDHQRKGEDGSSDDGWGAFNELKDRSKPLVQSLIPKLPEYEGQTIADVQAFHAARLKAQQEAEAKAAAVAAEAAAAQQAEATARASGKNALKVTYDSRKQKSAQVQKWADSLKVTTGALSASGRKAQGRAATLCTVTLSFADFDAAKAAIPLVESAGADRDGLAVGYL